MGGYIIGKPEQVVGFYDKEFKGAAPQTNYNEALAAFKQVGVPEASLRGKKVIDAGCGPGAYTLVMADAYGASVTAVDIESDCVDLTRDACGQRSLNVETRVDDVRNLSLPEGAYDTVVSVGVVYHTGVPLDCLRSFYRVLKSGGECYVSLIRRSFVTDTQYVLFNVYHRLPRLIQKVAYNFILGSAKAVAACSRKGGSRFHDVRVGVHTAIYCPFQQVETDEGWCNMLKGAGFLDVRKIRSWNIGGHQGLYYGRKP